MDLFSKIIVISDNFDLSKFILKEITKHNVSVDLYFSKNNTVTVNEMTSLGASVIDVKSDNTINFILENYELVISLHCKQIFPAKLVNNITCINVHPGFNPYNRGWFPQAFSIINKKPIGATIHMMDEKIDNGYIIDQAEVEVLQNDTSFEVYRKVIDLEKKLLEKNIPIILNKTYKTKKPTFEGNYNSIKDYNNLCKLDLNHVGTLQEHIDLLRALTHDSFKNAYFYDNQNNKFFVRINFDKDH